MIFYCVQKLQYTFIVCSLHDIQEKNVYRLAISVCPSVPLYVHIIQLDLVPMVTLATFIIMIGLVSIG